MIFATLFAATIFNGVAVTHHVLHLDGTAIAYTARAGTITLKNAKDQPVISMFYTAYTQDGAAPSTRPVTFFYNGGPGGSSVWQHMAAFGPIRVLVPRPGQSLAAPYRMVDNQYSLLDVTDEVYVDAPGTGFSRLLKDAKPTDAYGVDADAAAFAQFIRRYFSEYGRWSSPKYLFGESYGTIRSAAVARLMQNGFGQAINLNGVVLMSSALNVDLLWDDEMVGGNDWPFVLFLPTEAATAWYHHRVPGASGTLEAFLADVEHFALTDYLEALAAGDALPADRREAIVARLRAYTGLSAATIRAANLRVAPGRFRSELLRDQGKVVGYMDARYSGYDPVGNRTEPGWDTSDLATTPQVQALFNDYVRERLQYRTNLEYLTLIDVLDKWSWKHQTDLGGTAALMQPPDTVVDLSEAMAQNPAMRVFGAMGYYDLSTPYFQQEYDFTHLRLPADLRKNLTLARYEAGHMPYIDETALAKVKADLARWYRSP